MKKKSFVAALVWAAGLGRVAMGDPSNTTILDGRPTEYDGVDLRGTFVGVGAWEGRGWQAFTGDEK